MKLIIQLPCYNEENPLALTAAIMLTLMERIVGGQAG